MKPDEVRRLTPHEIAEYSEHVTEEKVDFMIRSNWMAGYLAIPAYHAPKKYPESPEKLLKKQRKEGEAMSPEEMLAVFEKLVGNYGGPKDTKPISKGAIGE